MHVFGHPGRADIPAPSNPLDLLDAIAKGNRTSKRVDKAIKSGNPAALVSSAKKKSKARTSGSANTGIDDIAMLESMLDNFGQVDPATMERLKADLRRAVAGQFDPQISNIKKGMKRAKKRAKSAQKELSAIYDDLVSYYQGQVAPTKERSKAARKEAATAATALERSITDDYASRVRDQIDEFKRLGIQASTPSATEGQDAALANALAVAENTRAAEEAALRQQAEGDIAYWTEGSGIAKREGAEQRSLITQQLQDFLNEQDEQLSLLRGQRKAAYNTGLMELEQQAASAAMQQQNQLWSRMMDLARLKLSAAKASGSGATRDPGKGLSGAIAYLQQTGNAGLGSTFQNYLSAAQRWVNTPQARAMYGGAVDTPEEWAQVIRDHAINMGQPPRTQDALWQAMLRYMGRG